MERRIRRSRTDPPTSGARCALQEPDLTRRKHRALPLGEEGMCRVLGHHRVLGHQVDPLARLDHSRFASPATCAPGRAGRMPAVVLQRHPASFRAAFQGWSRGLPASSRTTSPRLTGVRPLALPLDRQVLGAGLGAVDVGLAWLGVRLGIRARRRGLVVAVIPEPRSGLELIALEAIDRTAPGVA